MLQIGKIAIIAVPVKYHMYCCLVLILVLVQCGSRSPKSAPQPAPEAAEEVVSPAAPQPSDEKRFQLTRTDQDNQEPEESPVTQRSDTLWSLGIRNTITPYDFEIESLQYRYPQNREKREVLEVIEALIASIQDGEVPENLFIEGKSLFFINSLQSPTETPIIEHRLGKITFEEKNRVRTALRFFSETGVTEGDIYLEKSDDRWLVSDIQINLRRLKEVYTGRTEQYQPSNYGWITNTY